MLYIQEYDSPIGKLVMASDGQSLTGLWFEGQKYFAAGLSTNAEQKKLPVFEQTAYWIDCYFSGEKTNFTPPIKLIGSEFRKDIWSKLQDIEYSNTTTYGQLAACVAKDRGLKSMSAQAVGGAVCHNPISIIIPCHRVIGADGKLTGYAGGIWRKKYLLELEGIDTGMFTIDK